ncbi:MAG: Wzy polymerase domain-containing protein, partial [Pseudomonas sp.]|uniref:PglL family O-oligosaccharyltransferase n=1 Tax=Pseudomonas sp. TaxID=306 RepID=UPI0030F1852F
FYALTMKAGWVGGAGTAESDVVVRGALSSPRLQEWRVTLELIRENFLGGIGIGNYAVSSYEQHLALGTPSPDGALFNHSHNSPMQVVVELGLAGLIWLLVLIALAAKAFWRASRQQERLLPLMVVLAIQVYSLIEFPLWMMHFLALHMLLLGALGGASVTIKFKRGRLFSIVALLATLMLSVIYLPLAERMVWSFRQYFLRTQVQQQDYRFVNAMIRDPLLEPFGYALYFANFDLSAESLEKEREVLERFRHYLPYPQIMVRLALVQMIDGNEAAARKTLSELNRFYGDRYKPALYEQLAATKERFPNVAFGRLLVPEADAGK